MSIQRRLRALERRASGSDDMVVFTILGGMPEPDLKTAMAGQHRWRQEASESFDAFQHRVVQFSKASGENVVMIGSLPDDRDERDERHAIHIGAG